MSLPRIVVDNSAVLPAFFPEGRSALFDAGLVAARSRSLVHAIRTRRVNAFVPPSFFREFLHVAVTRAQTGGRTAGALHRVREQWEDLVSLPLISVPLAEILHHSGILTFDDSCPPNDAWYVVAAVHANATFWMSHDHGDGLFAVASKHVNVRLLSRQAANY